MAVLGARAAQGSAWPSHAPGLFGPAVAAMVMAAVFGGRAALRRLFASIVDWRVRAWCYAVALSPLLLFALGAVVARVRDGSWPILSELGRFSSLPYLSPPVMLAALTVLAYAEEIGWRGAMVPALQRTRGALATNLLVGLAWALWHVPSMFVIENYRELGAAVVPGFLLGILAGSVFLTWLYNVSGGSVWIAALWHGVYNLVAGTAAAHGVVAAVVSSGVMAAAVLIVVVQLRARSRPARPGRTLRPV